MAEGFAKELGKGLLEPYSAGLIPSIVNSRAIQVMQEIGIDISKQTSKAIDPDVLGSMDVIITVCGHAEDLCPVTPPEIRRLHWPIDDPTGATGTEDEIVQEFRRARDEIRTKTEEFIKQIKREDKD
jgi:arsenate reductase